MSADKKWQLELDEYIRQGEPDKKEKSEAWEVAIGLQAVDGLNTSEYLLKTAKEHIEGNITIDVFLERLKYIKGITFQYYFGTQRAINYLKRL